jgi:C1A family cysteine protease
MRTRASARGAEMLAVEPLWQHCLNAGRAGHKGTTLAAGADAIETKGQPVEADWPYNPELGAGTETEPITATEASWFHAATLDVPLFHDGIESLIEDALVLELPVVLIIELTAELEGASAEGQIAVPALLSPASDYHAVIAVGAATTDDGEMRRLLIRNSWGEGWGAGGYGWLPLDYLIAFAGEATAIDPTSLSAAEPDVG